MPKLVSTAKVRLALTASTAEMIGPAVTGFLVQALSAPRAILIDSVSFLLSAAFLSRLRVNQHAPAAAEKNMFRESYAGLRCVVRHPLLRPLLLRDAAASFFYGFFSTLYVLFCGQGSGHRPGREWPHHRCGRSK